MLTLLSKVVSKVSSDISEYLWRQDRLQRATLLEHISWSLDKLKRSPEIHPDVRCASLPALREPSDDSLEYSVLLFASSYIFIQDITHCGHT